MIRRIIGAFFVVGALLPAAVRAEPVTIASAAQGSSTYNFALAISKAASEKQALDLRPQPYGSTSQASTFVNSGQVNFGLENAIAIRQAMLGEDRFKNHRLGELRLVARLVPLRMTLAVRADSGIASMDDLKGRRLPSGFQQAVTGEPLVSAMLATSGLSYDDVERVQVANFTAMAEAFVAGDLDAFLHVIGTPRDEQVARDVNGLKALQLGADDGASERIKPFVPVASLMVQQPEERLTTIIEATQILQYDYFIYTHAGESDETVTALLRALSEGKETMLESVASLNWFEPDEMYVDVGLPYHPAAEAFYLEQGQKN